MPSLKDRIIQILIDDNLISKADLERALKIQREKGGQLREILVKSQFINEDKLLIAVSKVFSKPSIDISRFKISSEVLKIIPANICRQYLIMPISK